MGRNDGPNEADDPRMDVEDFDHLIVSRQDITTMIEAAVAKAIPGALAMQISRDVSHEIERRGPQQWKDLVAVVKAEVRSALAESALKEAMGTPGPPHIKPDWDDRFPRASSFVHPNPSYGLYGTMFSSMSPDAVRDAGADYKVDEQQRRALRRLKHELRRLAIQVAERELAELGGTDALREERARFNLAMVCDILKS